MADRGCIRIKNYTIILILILWSYYQFIDVLTNCSSCILPAKSCICVYRSLWPATLWEWNYPAMEETTVPFCAVENQRQYWRVGSFSLHNHIISLHRGETEMWKNCVAMTGIITAMLLIIYFACSHTKSKTSAHDSTCISKWHCNL